MSFRNSVCFAKLHFQPQIIFLFDNYILLVIEYKSGLNLGCCFNLPNENVLKFIFKMLSRNDRHWQIIISEVQYSCDSKYLNVIT